MQRRETPPLNLLVVFPDGHRGQDTGLAGNRQVSTPNIDRLGAEGVSFTRAYANSTVCTPSRASMLTGLYPVNHRAIANDLPVRTDVPTIATELGQSGYATGYIGKWHLDGVPRDRFTPPGPRRLGFDDFWEAWNCQEDTFGARYYADDPVVRHYEDYAPFAQADAAIRFMETHRRDPFVLFLSWTPPNASCKGLPEEYLRHYDPGALSLRPNVFSNAIEPTLGYAPSRNRAKAREVREALACHYAYITSLDEALGRVLCALDELDLTERTIVVYTSDHGRPVCSHGYHRSELPYEESSRVPLVIRAPGKLPSGVTTKVLTGLVDLTPTLLDLLGHPVPPDMEGASVLPAVMERAEPPRSVLQSIPVPFDGVEGLNMSWRAIRTDRFTYARWENGSGWLLYDNETDPYQLRNLIGDDSATRLSIELEDELKRQLERHGDEFFPWRELLLRSGLAPDWNVRDKLYFGGRQQVELEGRTRDA